MQTNTINFQSRTDAGASDTFERELESDGVVTRLYLEAVPGEEADVERRWFIENPNGRRRPITVNATSRDYLAGDDTVFDLTVHEEFTGDERLVLEVDNTDPNYGYPNIAFAEVAMGEMNLIDRLIGGAF